MEMKLGGTAVSAVIHYGVRLKIKLCIVAG
jgi:hypothetical protein